MLINMWLDKELKSKILIFYAAVKLSLKFLILDQIVKWWFINYLKNRPDSTIKVFNFFDIVSVWNYGISFGILKDYHQYSNIFFIIINSAIIFYLWYLLIKCTSFISFLGYSAIIGGAVGNVLDRIFRGAVFDFLYFHYNDYGFPVFNLADSFICAGACVILYDFYKQKKLVEAKINSNYDELEIELNKNYHVNKSLAEEAERIRELDQDNIKFKEN